MLVSPAYGQAFDPTGPLPDEFQGGIRGFEGDYFESLDAFTMAPRCFVHEMSMPGQGVYISGSAVYISGSGVYISGSARGLVPGTQVTIVDPGPPVSSVTVGAIEPGQLVWSAPTGSAVENYEHYLDAEPIPGSTVGILVVDDFAGLDINRLDEMLADLPALTPIDTATLESMFDSGDLSHGLFVLAHLKALIEATGNYHPGGIEGGWYQWVHGAVEGSRLAVVPVAISRRSSGDPIIPVDTQQIVASITSALREYSDRLDPGGGPLSLVVNMSWVLLPCATIKDFLMAGDAFDSFEQYVMGLEIDPNGSQTPSHADLAWRVSLLSWVPEDDPLREYFEGTSATGVFAQAAGVEVALVAAAGNFNMEYQMLPAALPTVLGVGTPLVGQPPPEFSNAADVAARGAWFHLDGVVSYAGTSYSAPLVSLFAAVDLAANKSCMPAGANASRPGFGIAKVLGGHMGPRTPLNVAADTCFVR